MLRLPDLDHCKLAVLNPRLTFNRIVVVRYRMYLKSCGLAQTPSTRNWLPCAAWLRSCRLRFAES
jgi:hypothetical protein